MVAENGDCAVAKGAHEAQDLEGLWAAVHQIAGEPQRVPARLEIELVEQASQLVITALHVSDGEYGHALLVQAAGDGQREWRDRGVELQATIIDHLVAATHGPHRRLEDSAAGVSETFPGT